MTQSTPETTSNQSQPTLRDLADKLDKLTTEQERFNDRFSNYQQATQWVVQLAFTLIASATLTVIITAIVKR
ncbi:MAG: hypothetical protein VKJ46_12020 [Leptolyngbyaceae bacterium]|nr:hypothetical protein [Leptolyngbyaceae bacterium]